MNEMRAPRRRRHACALHFLRGAALLCTALVMGACDSDSVGPPRGDLAEVAVVLNSIERSLTVIPVDSPDAAFTIGIAPEGSPVTLDERNGLVVVPLGTVPGVAVVDLALGTVVRTVSLPSGSQATGAAFVNDSIAIIGNAGLNTVSVVNVLRGSRGEDIAVGTFPHVVVASNDTAYVLNAQLGPDFQPTGPGTVSVIAGSPPAVIATVPLQGFNPGAAAIAGGNLYVLHAGHFGMNDGSLSIVDRAGLEEDEHVEGFGEFPGSIAIAPDGNVVVAGFGFGVAVWNPASRSFTHPPSSPIAPGGIPATAGIGFDSAGRLYALEPECAGPGSVFRLDADYEVETEIEAGICPVAVVFAELES